MIDKDKVNAMTQAELREEIKLKRRQREECVGWLYASILDDEIYELEIIWEKRHREGTEKK